MYSKQEIKTMIAELVSDGIQRYEAVQMVNEFIADDEIRVDL